MKVENELEGKIFTELPLMSCKGCLSKKRVGQTDIKDMNEISRLVSDKGKNAEKFIPGWIPGIDIILFSITFHNNVALITNSLVVLKFC